ncbi:pectate lyase [Runella limosa]|uniref:pectate lyase n=1 Tax=Runella limosa TaxID=370978 RepID=UPI00041C4F0B|nr:pectate lyase [Runella limosa]
MKQHFYTYSKKLLTGSLMGIFLLPFLGIGGCSYGISTLQEVAKDSVAERMLLFQRNNGGWPQPGGDPINYDLVLTSTQKATLLAEKAKLDATIDDKATTREINALVSAFKKTQNTAYLKAAENGIKYLLTAQNSAGGWGQFFPDTSGYHKHITYNDQAMMDVMWIFKNIIDGKKDFDAVKTLIPQAKAAMAKGIDCILKTQYVQQGKLTAWCAQHDRKTLLPAKARAFELASLSGNESVGIVQFLMAIDNPSPEIKRAIQAAVAWLDSVKIVGIRVDNVVDASQPKGKDRIVVADPTSTLWARFYELDTNKPFFTGRNSVPKATLAEIENERRVGYAYYGNWPVKLLSTEYPNWVQKWEK